MDGTLLIYLGALLPFGWGLSHLLPTGKIVQGFGDITADNRHIIRMEWITEGVALMFIGVLVALVTFVDQSSIVSWAVYWAAFGVLNVLSVVSLFTGFRHPFIMFKLCPVVFTGSSLLIIIGSYLG